MGKKLRLKKSVILVTGGAGFIGSHIVDRLISSGQSVIIADDLSTGSKQNINPKALFYNVDVSNKAALIKIFKKHNIAYCIHQAAKINLNVKLEDPSKDVLSSVLGTINLLKCCVDFKIKKFIYASSVAVYGRPEKLPVEEGDKLIPVYSYGIAKKCAEEYINYYSINYGLNYSILRYGNVFGPRQPIYGEVGVIAIFVDRIFKNIPLTIYGDGSHVRDYIYIDDVADITIKMLTNGDRQIYNAGCGKPTTVNEIFKCFCSVAKSKLPYEFKPERVGELGRFYADSSKLSKLLGRPGVSVQEGIEKTYFYYKNLNSERLRGEVTLKPICKGDLRMIFKWRNNPFLVSLGSTGKTVTWQEHSKWFDRILKSRENKLFVVLKGAIPVGQVRFDLHGKETYKISIYLLEEYLHQGIGSVALEKSIRLMRAGNKGKKFIAFIKERNIYSKRVFSRNGFKTVENHPEKLPGHIVMEYYVK